MITLDLPPKLETTLHQTANRQGLTTENWLLNLINKELVLTAQPTKSYAKGDFNFDLERMQKAVEAPSITVPKFDTDEEFLTWLENLTDKDFVKDSANAG